MSTKFKKGGTVKTQSLIKKTGILLISMVIVISQIIAAVPAMAAEDLPIAQYVTTNGNAQCGADKNSATYNGTMVRLKLMCRSVLFWPVMKQI